VSYVLAAAKATLSPLRSALCARMHSLKAAARAWQRLPAGPCAQGHRWYERACHCHCQCHAAGDP